MALFFNDAAYDRLIASAAQRYAPQTTLTPSALTALVKAIIRQESRFDPHAYRFEPFTPGTASDDDASRGLMQVLGKTARIVGYGGTLGNDTTHMGGLYDPATSIDVGTRVLVANLQQSGGNVENAVSAYNAGFSASRPWDAKRDANGARINASYVAAVMQFYNDYLARGASGNGVTEGSVGGGVDWKLVGIAGGVGVVAWLLLKLMGVGR